MAKIKKIKQTIKEPVQKIKYPESKPVSKDIQGMIKNKYEMPNR